MTRAIEDTSSTCKTCVYWERLDRGGDAGRCNYVSIPGWAQKYLSQTDEQRRMSAEDGLTCWMHSKRGLELKIDGKSFMQRLAARSGNFCRVCGRDHNMMPCGPPDSASAEPK